MTTATKTEYRVTALGLIALHTARMIRATHATSGEAA